MRNDGVVGVQDSNFHARADEARGLQRLVIGVFVGPGWQSRDGHRRLALTIELGKHGSETLQGGAKMPQMDRSAAVDDRAQRRDLYTWISLEKPHDHCGREEGQDSHALICDETQDAVWIEAPARVDDILRDA